MTPGAVTRTADAAASETGRTLTGDGLEQRFASIVRERWELGDASEVLFVVAGRGMLRVDGEEHALDPEAGAFLGPGETAEVESSNGRIDLIAVRAAPAAPAGPRVVRYSDESAEDAGIGREFRLLACSTAVTQFVGVIPPGRAKMHNHPYDELSYLVEGEGVLHWQDGTRAPVAAGSCIHFPRLVFHSLENILDTPMRIMGVFTPAGSPADRVAVLDY